MPVPSRPQQVSPHQALYDMHEEAARFYHAILNDDQDWEEEARAYLYKRGLTDEVLKHFQIGLAPAERTYLYQRLADKFEEKDLLDSGLFYLSDGNQFHDTFFGRIIFPLTMIRGRSLPFQVVSGKKQIIRLPSIKIVAQLQFLTRVMNCIIWTRLKKELGKFQNST